MENEKSVKVASEKSVEVQFGKDAHYREKKTLSPKMMFFFSIGAILALVPILQIQSPEKNADDDIKLPDTSTPSSTTIEVQQYSATQENKEAKNTQKHIKTITRYAGIQSIDRPNAGKIPPGSLVRARLITGGSNGPIKAELMENLEINGELLIPQGANLLGIGQSTEDRLFIKFNKVVLYNGQVNSIQAEAADISDKIVGLKGSNMGKYAAKLAAAVGLNFVSGMSEGLVQKESVGSQVVNKADPRNALLHGASHASLELANETMTNLKNQTPVINVDAGKEIFVIFDQD